MWSGKRPGSLGDASREEESTVNVTYYPYDTTCPPEKRTLRAWSQSAHDVTRVNMFAEDDGDGKRRRRNKHEAYEIVSRRAKGKGHGKGKKPTGEKHVERDMYEDMSEGGIESAGLSDFIEEEMGRQQVCVRT